MQSLQLQLHTFQQMFHEARLPNITLKIKTRQREDGVLSVDVEINQSGEVNVNQLLLMLQDSTAMMTENSQFFYFDHCQNVYVLVNIDEISYVHFTTLISENVISLKIQQRMSDELLANPTREDEEIRTKRSRERIIEEAFLLVEQWRCLYREGTFNQLGQKIRINLDHAAHIIGASRKTLEDYYLLFRYGKAQLFNFAKFKRQKIGVLRSFIKEKGKIKEDNKQKSQFDQKTFFLKLRKEIVSKIRIKNEEEQIFDVMRSLSNSSDEQLIYQN